MELILLHSELYSYLVGRIDFFTKIDCHKTIVINDIYTIEICRMWGIDTRLHLMTHRKRERTGNPLMFSAFEQTRKRLQKSRKSCRRLNGVFPFRLLFIGRQKKLLFRRLGGVNPSLRMNSGVRIFKTETF